MKRRGMVDSAASISVRRQCEFLGLSRSGLYYEPVEVDAETLRLMRRMDELHLQYPFFGSRMLTQTLKKEGWLGQSQAHPAADAFDGPRKSGPEAGNE